eukprot:760631-Hanusia_phi.AAC.2
MQPPSFPILRRNIFSVLSSSTAGELQVSTRSQILIVFILHTQLGGYDRQSYEGDIMVKSQINVLFLTKIVSVDKDGQLDWLRCEDHLSAVCWKVLPLRATLVQSDLWPLTKESCSSLVRKESISVESLGCLTREGCFSSLQSDGKC